MLSLKEMTDLLKEEGLYKETIVNGHWSYTLPDSAARVEPRSLAYDSRKVGDGTLFFCKGNNFNPKYLESAIEAGASAFMSELVYHDELSTAA